MSRSPTRTPPIRINPSLLSSLAALDPAALTAVIRISAHHYEAGRPMTVGEFGSHVGEDGLFLHAILQDLSHLLDQSALVDGNLVVSEIARGLEHRAEIMSKRSEAAHLRYVRAAAEQKSSGSEIKLTRGRISKRSKVATAASDEDAQMQPVCTHVHNAGDYAHVCSDGTCTCVHNQASDAHMCIGDASTHVHKKASDAHVYIDDDAESDAYYAQVCIPPASEDFEIEENRGVGGLDRNDDPSHVRARPLRADLSLSNSSSKKNKRDESTRVQARDEEPRGSADGYRTGHRPHGNPRPVATSDRNGNAQHLNLQGSIISRLTGSRPSAGSSRTEVPAEFVRRLLEAGPVDGDNARRQLAKWIDKWGEPFVRSGIDAIPNKKIARPMSYLSSILTNLAKEAEGRPDAHEPSAGGRGKPQEAGEASPRGALPRRVKRRVSLPPGASWERLGWTAKGHEGDRPSGRMQVWRTESGDLRYMDAPASETVPTYEEDPGVYAYD